MQVSATTPGALISACYAAIQGYHATQRQAEQTTAIAAPEPARQAAPGGLTQMPVFAAPPPVQEGAVSRAAVQEAQRAYDANAAATHQAVQMAGG